MHRQNFNKIPLYVSLLFAAVCCLVRSNSRVAATALLVLGSICFIPGFYHVRIAYLAWKGVEGYSLESIPDM
jgi:lipopolysaccharide export LptBFGC system permease protein LptF